MPSRMLAAAGVVATQAPAADLTVKMRGFRYDVGGFHLAAHGPESKATFIPQEGVPAVRRESASAGMPRSIIRDLVSGRYAATAFHDEKGNRDLDTNPLGILAEEYVETASVAGDQPALGVKIGAAPHLLPPAPERLHRELCGVVVNADARPAGIRGEVEDTAGEHLAELLNDEVVDLHLLRLTFRTPFLTAVPIRPEQLLLLGVH